MVERRASAPQVACGAASRSPEVEQSGPAPQVPRAERLLGVSGVTTLLGDRAFWIAFGVAAAGAALVVAYRRAAPGGGRLRGSGIVTVVAALAGLRSYGPLRGWLVVAVVLVGLGAWVGGRTWLPVGILACAPGAACLALAVRDRPDWILALVGLLAPVAAPLAARLDCLAPRLGFLLLGISAVGLYACIPDSEPARPLVGALAPAAVLLLLAAGRRVRPRPGAAGALAALVLWSAAVGGAQRPGSVVGGAGCLGLVLVVPVVARALRPRDVGSHVQSIALVLGLHAALVGVASRVAGFRRSATAALLIEAAALASAVAVTLAVGRARR
jgi:hypothetical protein